MLCCHFQPPGAGVCMGVHIHACMFNQLLPVSQLWHLLFLYVAAACCSNCGLCTASHLRVRPPQNIANKESRPNACKVAAVDRISIFLTLGRWRGCRKERAQLISFSSSGNPLHTQRNHTTLIHQHVLQ